MTSYYRNLMEPRAAERFRHFDRLAAEQEIAAGLGRGALHFSRAELERNDDEQMMDLLKGRAETARHVMSERVA